MRERIPVVQHGRTWRRTRRRAPRRAPRRTPPRTPVVRALWGGAEIAVTLGLVLLLLVAHQLWWTNRQARAAAERKVQALEEEWGRGEGGASGPGGGSGDGAGSGSDSGAGSRSGAGAGAGGRSTSSSPDSDRPRTDSSGTEGRPPTPRWDQAYAVLRIPRIGIRVPVAEGVSKGAVLNQGYAGHYPRTAQPGRAGNFALAGHRNTHGEPFRHIDRLRRGDEVTVETAQATYTYVVEKTLARTSARDSGVIRTVPRSDVRAGYGYREPGYYVTLTTCTPEYTSKYRLVVWGKLRAMRPR
ncbi:class E sortase [Streptomyces sp. NPDC058284]|uniref:class E sortase n=1 Tax=unclassified Streptomyces TaxID=2593676 RepID=UPI003651CFDA